MVAANFSCSHIILKHFANVIYSESSSGRGVCSYCKSSLKATLFCKIKSKFDEALWCCLLLRHKTSLLIGVVYRSPNSDMNNDNNLGNLLNEVCSNWKGELLIMGNFNFPQIDWNQWCSNNSDVGGNNFLSSVADQFLYQHVNFPTRYREHTSTNPSLLDLILTRDENDTAGIKSMDPIGKK